MTKSGVKTQCRRGGVGTTPPCFLQPFVDIFSCTRRKDATEGSWTDNVQTVSSPLSSAFLPEGCYERAMIVSSPLSWRIFLQKGSFSGGHAGVLKTAIRILSTG